MDLFKAAVIPVTELCTVQNDEGESVETWDFLDRRRVVIQRNAVTRQRPAMRKGWSATCDLQVLLPEYVTPDLLQDVLTNAGRLVGVADFRPTFGRFRVTKFEKIVFSDSENIS